MIKIRFLTKKDIPQAAAIVGKNYSKEYQKFATLELKDMFGKQQFKPFYFVAEKNKKIVGFAGYTQSAMDYNIYEIFWVNVSPERQKQGIGQKLVSRVISEIKNKKDAKLILLSANIPNSRYYKQKFGFKILQPFGKEYHLMAYKLRSDI